MSISGSFIVPPGQSPPFTVVTDTDHEAWIVVATAFGLCCSLLFGGIRIFVRLTIARGVGLDDALLGVATVSLPLYPAPGCLSGATIHDRDVCH